MSRTILNDTCPECGGFLEYVIILTDPPVPVRRCSRCDWQRDATKEETERELAGMRYKGRHEREAVI